MITNLKEKKNALIGSFDWAKERIENKGRDIDIQK